jgi:hypothetical protein
MFLSSDLADKEISIFSFFMLGSLEVVSLIPKEKMAMLLIWQ